ncbi:MAG TPA: hypothetical protein VM536_02360 [Chloroflexia bacterium]|nr:hypothetical protein [Chloroflexia bacterium]
MTHEVIAQRLRRFLLLLSAAAFLTTLTELALEKHFDDPLQIIPWVLCVGALLALAGALLRPGPATFRILRGAMLIVGIGGLGGVVVHLAQNLSFEQEVHPHSAAGTLLLATLQGAAPLLAPGALTFGALLALASLYQHPALTRQARFSANSNDVSPVS